MTDTITVTAECGAEVTIAHPPVDRILCGAAAMRAIEDLGWGTYIDDASGDVVVQSPAHRRDRYCHLGRVRLAEDATDDAPFAGAEWVVDAAAPRKLRLAFSALRRRFEEG